MNNDQVKARLALLDSPEAKEQPMVYRVWEDGEVTLEKGGELFGQRTLHMIHPGGAALPAEWMPHQNHGGTHGYLFARDYEAVETAVAFIAEAAAST